MKQLEDRGWEAMAKLLDESLPQRKKKRGWLWGFIPLTGLLVVLAFMLNTTKELKDVPSQFESKTKQVSDISALAADRSDTYTGTEKAQIIETQSEKIEITGKYKGLNPDKKSIEKNVLSNYNATTLRQQRHNIGLDNNDPVSVNAVSNKTSEITESVSKIESDKKETVIITETDDVTESVNYSVLLQNRTTDVFAMIPAQKSDLLVPDELQPVANILYKKAKNKCPLGITVKAGVFMANNSDYIGAAISPQLNLRVSPRSDFFISPQLRYRKTREEVIYNEYSANALKYFADNTGITSNFDISIDTKSINVHTLDLGVDAGYRHHLLPNFNVGVFGFVRRNNILNKQPVTGTILSPGYVLQEAEIKSINSSVRTYDQKYNYGIGIDFNLNLGARSLIFASANHSLNQKKNYEFGLGYGFRLF